MEWTQYIILGFVFASLLFLASAAMLYWAHRNGQLRNFEEGSKSIFDEEEPLGETGDQFPTKRNRRKGRPEHRGPSPDPASGDRPAR